MTMKDEVREEREAEAREKARAKSEGTPLARHEAVLKEHDELAKQIALLSEFMGSEAYPTLHTHEQSLYQQQRTIMTKLLDVMVERISFYLKAQPPVAAPPATGTTAKSESAREQRV